MVYFSAGEISDSARVLVLRGSIPLKHTMVTRAKMIPLNQVCPSTNTRREGAFVASNNHCSCRGERIASGSELQVAGLSAYRQVFTKPLLREEAGESMFRKSIGH